jgi:hypothetical protein
MSKITLNDDGTASFSLNVLGNISRETFMGNFQVKCILSPLEFIKADKLYRELLGEDSINAHQKARSNAFALSQLQYRVLRYPPFWENREIGGGHIDDDNVLGEVIELAIQAEEQYRTQKKKEADDIQKMLTKKIKKGEIEKELEIDKVDEKTE